LKDTSERSIVSGVFSNVCIENNHLQYSGILRQ